MSESALFFRRERVQEEEDDEWVRSVSCAEREGLTGGPGCRKGKAPEKEGDGKGNFQKG